jgi:glucokinase
MTAATEPGGLVVALDIGGTKIACGLVAVDGTVKVRHELATVRADGRDPGLTASHQVAADLVAHAASQGWAVAGLGIGVPEYVTADGVLTSRLVLDWRVQPKEQFADLGPVTVDSDVRCGARAEALLGAGRGVSSMLYVTVGTGLSSTLVVDGVPYAGARGEAIAFGELPVDRRAATDEDGSLEAFASGEGIADRFRRHGEISVRGAAEVVALADQGHEVAEQIVASAAIALGSAIAWMVDVLDPAVVVLGGGLGTSVGRWEHLVRAEYERRSAARPGAAPLRRAQLGPDSGLVGAALAHRQARQELGAAGP